MRGKTSFHPSSRRILSLHRSKTTDFPMEEEEEAIPLVAIILALRPTSAREITKVVAIIMETPTTIALSLRIHL